MEVLLDHALEILLLEVDDTNGVKEGDDLEFQVLFAGTPLKNTASACARATYLGHSMRVEYGRNDLSISEEGFGTLKAPRAGTWEIHVYCREEFSQKTNQAGGFILSSASVSLYSASVSFEVRSADQTEGRPLF